MLWIFISILAVELDVVDLFPATSAYVKITLKVDQSTRAGGAAKDDS
jgi:hypothetical protein